MKIKKGISNFLIVLSVVMMAVSVAVVIMALDTSPVIIEYPEDAVQLAEKMMEAVCDADYKTASKMMYGKPNLGSYPPSANMATILIWEAFLESLEYDLNGSCYACDSGVAVDVWIRYLDVPKVIAGLEERARELLNQRIEQASDMGDIYDENNEYRQDMIERILQESVQSSLEENREYKEQTIPLKLIYDRGEWWVLPESQLLRILAGAFEG